MRLSHTLGGCDNLLHGREFPVKIPNSISWAMTHPFQGGGVSPR